MTSKKAKYSRLPIYLTEKLFAWLKKEKNKNVKFVEFNLDRICSKFVHIKCVCVCVFVWKRERERDIGKKSVSFWKRERVEENECVCLCVCLTEERVKNERVRWSLFCVCVSKRQSEMEKYLLYLGLPYHTFKGLKSWQQKSFYFLWLNRSREKNSYVRT